MTMTDTIADLLTRVRNAYKAGHEKVEVPASALKYSICEVLKKEGYIKSVEKKDEDGMIEILLKYAKNGDKVFAEIKRVSKPGRRIYVKCEEIRKVRGGLGIAIISTSKGVMSDRMARKEGVGGELLCTVW
ncbi:MAG: hypothetical protein ACD_79C01488G0006 [uncultured bacterium]|nr:MAG: hypothetical protein ACD_79C01488G0006 [uncultured bacterium]